MSIVGSFLVIIAGNFISLTIPVEVRLFSHDSDAGVRTWISVIHGLHEFSVATYGVPAKN